ncbi:MAG: ACP phosphodiesterase [Bacteroidota bacterium]
MNFLAHTYLSYDNDDIVFGNFVADAIKGKAYLKYRKDIISGVLLHRSIDVFTDRHPIVKNSKAIVRNNFGKYSGIVVDIYYDHFLARNWANYHNDELSTFSTKVYMILARRFMILPARVKRMLPFLIAQNWLSGYANMNDLQRVFNGMDRRTNNVSGMHKAIKVLEDNYDALFLDFEKFFAELMVYADQRLLQITTEDNTIES